MQPDAASTIGFIWWGLSLWLGAFGTLSEILVPRSVMREAGLPEMEDFGEIQIQSLHFSDMDPEFQGGERNRSRPYSELVVGVYIHPLLIPFRDSVQHTTLLPCLLSERYITLNSLFIPGGVSSQETEGEAYYVIPFMVSVLV